MRNIKRFFLIIILISMAGQVSARRYVPSSALNYSRVDNNRIHFGYSVGIGVFDYRLDNAYYKDNATKVVYLAEPVKFSPALRLGVVAEVNMSNFFSFRAIPGLYFGNRTITYKKQLPGDTKSYLAKDVKVGSVYADFPFLIKYRGERINNYNYFVLLGVSYHFDLTPHEELDPKKQILIRTKIHDFALEIGGGMDLYLDYFKLGIELRVSIGMIDVLNHSIDEKFKDYQRYTRTIEKLKSTLVTLSFNFE